ncbi:enoyl-CoA hydratase/isomerase family protein [Pseudohaliea sp.]|uniref:enoyl-CoA hydratase/isomerase family protein n=1 Tax=Pseudohaliea sp. TaxID=2740289 RepID=UPI0032EF4B3D
MSQIDLQKAAATATVFLDRADKGNALSTGMITRLTEVMEELADQQDVAVVVIRGRGNHFCVGADLKEWLELQNSGDLTLRDKHSIAEQGAKLLNAIQALPQPTICATQGIANGGGACIAVACDFRVAERGASMGFGEVTVGMNLMWGGLPLCTRLIGPARAKRMIMSGKQFPAETLSEWGMVDYTVDEGDIDAGVQSLVEEFSGLPPIALRMIKRSINAVSGASDAAVMHMQSDQWLLAAATEDCQEGLKAFFERREPRFTGN